MHPVSGTEFQKALSTDETINKIAVDMTERKSEWFSAFIRHKWRRMLISYEEYI